MFQKVVLLTAASVTFAATAFAQTDSDSTEFGVTLAPTVPKAAPATAQTTKPNATRAGMRSVRDVLGRLETGIGAGVRLVADSTVANDQVPLPKDTVTSDTVAAQLDTLVAALPKGTVWAKLYLPESTARAYKGDDLAEYALAQSRLFGKIGDVPAGSVEVMGKILPMDKAQAVIDALNLKPVYLVTNPIFKAVGAGDTDTWAALTDVQKADFAKKEAAKRLAMGPEAFAKDFSAYISQQGAVMGQMFGQMSPQQRDSYRDAMMKSFQNGGAGNMMWMGNMGGGGGGGNWGQRGNRQPKP